MVASDKPKDGYNSARPEGGVIESGLYEAKDVEGNTVKFKFRISAGAGGDRPSFEVNELRYYN